MVYSKAAKGQMALEKHLAENGWNKDRFGHWHLEKITGVFLRFKMQKTSCRYERKMKITTGYEWVNKTPGRTLYYKNFHLVGSKISFNPSLADS